MANVSTLKDRARSFEQGEQWKNALDTYQQLVQETESDDSGLWNRIGDLHMRLGQPDQAVAAYEHAVEKYMDVGLLNNAIALCNKILRAAPDRTPTYLKLGQISAAQGFLADARRNFLQFAERMIKAGDLDASFAALKEFAGLSPKDGEVRRLLADQLRAHDREQEAIEQLVILIRLHESQGKIDDAEAVRREVLDMDPSADLAALGEGVPGHAFGSMSGRASDRGPDVLPTYEATSRTPAPPEPAAEAPEFHIDMPEPDESMAGVDSLEGLEPTLQDDTAGDEPEPSEDSLLEIRVGEDEAETPEDLFVRAMEAAAETEPLAEVEDADQEFEISPAAGSEAEMVTTEPTLETVASVDDQFVDGVADITPLDGFEATLAEDVEDDFDDHGDTGALPLLDGEIEDEDELQVVSAADEMAGALDEAADALLADDELEGDEGESSLPLLADSDEWEYEQSAETGDIAEIVAEEALDETPEETLEETPEEVADDLPSFEPAAIAEPGGEADSESYREEPTPEPEWEPAEEELADEEVSGDEPAGVEGDRLQSLRSRFEAVPADSAIRTELVSLLREQDLADEVASVLERGHRALAAEDRYPDATDLVRDLLRLRADDTALYQKQVEYAFRAGDRERLVQAYLDLGRHLESGDNPAKAGAVYQRVLELDPDNAEARRSLTPSVAAPGSMGGPTTAGDGEYVDLAALIFDDDIKEPSTRFIVPEDEPTGDEDHDFEEMLSRFRQKVAENIGVEDSTSHYDLGLAFKDMGLLDEAISQFQVALRGGANPLATLEVLGECFVEKGQFSLASRVLDRALRLPDVDEQNLVGVYYWLGRCEEVLGRTQSACDHFERVLSLDLRFRDASSRLDALRPAR